ncbi:MAG: acyl-CoA dehydrogenase family protein [Candidatus Omnitrophica bacterium]|nr:acyl-CoA dehydrogenase family protein [Candidatus Omnitrophota bacterium]
MSTAEKLRAHGYSFLIQETAPEDVFTPEDLTEEHRQFAESADSYLKEDVEPHLEELEKLDRKLLIDTLKKAGEAGLFMIEVPEEYGGLGLDLMSQVVVTEKFGKFGGFAVAYGCQTGIGIEPLLFFGTDEQKEKYLSRLATGEIIGAYALTEPGSGSDALAAKTTAKLSDDGSEWILNGSKCFISNGGIADIYTLFAQVDGDKFSAFLIERDTPGFTVGGEEDKMGIKSSSTTVLTLQDVKIPKENLLGEIGKGHKIALNILNLGRLKLGAGVVGGAKDALKESINYGITRKQFGARLVDFPLIRQKIAKMVTGIYSSESIAFRTTGDIDHRIALKSTDSSPSIQEKMDALEEFAGECAMNKIYDSEWLDFVVDEAVQIHGGYGFIEEYPVARGYRDARISRIYEGTNEINRLNISGYLFGRAMKGRLALIPEVQKIQEAVLNPIEPYDGGGKPLSDVAEAVFNSKRILLFVSGVLSQKFMPELDKLTQEQEALSWMADIITQIYALESTYLRALKRIQSGDSNASQHEDVARYQMALSTAIIEDCAKSLIDGYFEDDSRRTNLSILKKFSKWPHVNTVEIGRRIAQAAIDREDYPFAII